MAKESDIMLTIGLETKDAYKTADDLKKEIEHIFDSRKGKSSPQLMAMESQLKNNYYEAKKLQTEMQRLKKITSASQRYDDLTNRKEQLKEQKKNLAQIRELMAKNNTEAIRDPYSGMIITSESLKKSIQGITQEQIQLGKELKNLQKLFPQVMDEKAISKANQQLTSLTIKLDGVNDRMKQGVIKYREASTESTQFYSNAISSAKQYIGIVGQVAKVILKPLTVGKNFYVGVFKSFTKGTEGILRNFKKIIGTIGTLRSKLKSLGGSNDPFRKLIGNVLKYGLGISSLFVLINKLRNVVTSNFGDVIKASDKAKEALNNLKGSWDQLGHQITAIFEPILVAIEPILTSIIDKLTQAALAVTQFMGAITGQSKILKAKKSLNALAGAAGEANKQLSKLDNLNVLSTSGSEYDMEEIDSKYVDLWKVIKDTWQMDIPDFTWLGKKLATKIDGSLSNIDWAKIFSIAMKAGFSISTFINGFFDKNMLITLGEAIANGINTAITFAASFVKKLQFGQIAKNIAAGIITFINTIHWETLTLTISKFIEGIFKFISNYINELTDPEKGLDIARIRTNLENLVINIFNSLKAFVEDLNWGNFTDKLIEFFSFDVVAVAESISAFFNELADQDIFQKLREGIFIFLGETQTGGSSKSAMELGTPIPGMDPKDKRSGLAGFFETLIENTDIDRIIYDLSQFSVKIIKRFAENINGLLNSMADNVNSTILGESIGEVLNSILNAALLILNNEKFQKWISDVIANINIPELAEKFGDIVWQVWEALKSVIPWEQIREIITPILEDMFDMAITIIVDMATGDKADYVGEMMLKGLKQGLWNCWAMVDPIGALVNWIIRKFKEKLGIASPSKVFREFGVYLMEGLINGINSMKDKLKTPINAILSFFENMANGVIDALNAMIDKINSLDFDIPDWVPLVGGKSLGFTIPNLQNVTIPKLAQGAVIPPNKEFMAVLGDQKSGTNIETPLDTMKEAFLQVLEARGISGNQEIVLQLDGREFLRAMVKANGEYKKQHGGASAMA